MLLWVLVFERDEQEKKLHFASCDPFDSTKMHLMYYLENGERIYTLKVCLTPMLFIVTLHRNLTQKGIEHIQHTLVISISFIICLTL